MVYKVLLVNVFKFVFLCATMTRDYEYSDSFDLVITPEQVSKIKSRLLGCLCRGRDRSISDIVNAFNEVQDFNGTDIEYHISCRGFTLPDKKALCFYPLDKGHGYRSRKYWVHVL